MSTDSETTTEELAKKLETRRRAAYDLFAKLKDKPSEELDKILARLGIRIK